MNQAGIRPLKRLGQNFLVNPKICERLIHEVREIFPQTVVEIGPGLGALTDDLVGGSWKTTLIEMDAGLVEFWRARSPTTPVIHGDALKLDWREVQVNEPSVLVSNLPYSIAASIVVEMSSGFVPFDFMILMFQKEVAERIESEPRDENYGMLTVVAQANWNITRVIDAGPQDFFPVPHVGSRVLKFERKNIAFDKKAFLAFVKLAFAQRRKKLISNLSTMGTKEEAARAISVMGLAADVRAQDLTTAQFLELFTNIAAKR